jgi:hypothetical protein
VYGRSLNRRLQGIRRNQAALVVGSVAGPTIFSHIPIHSLPYLPEENIATRLSFGKIELR